MDQPQRNGIRSLNAHSAVPRPQEERGRNCREPVISDPHPLTHEFTLNWIPFKNKLKAIKLTEQKIIESMADKGAGCGCDS